MAITQELNQVPWLLLVFSLPVGRGSQRVEVWRKLQRFGAIALGNSGYLLPNQPANLERFEWLAAAIRNYRGDASVVEVQAIDNLSNPQLAGKFREASTRSFRALLRDAQRIIASPVARRPPAKINRLRQRFQEIAATDFFGSSLRGRVERLMERVQSEKVIPSPTAPFSPQQRKTFRGRTWVTRPRPHVDRVHSAWLIRRYIDPRAKFAFAKEGQVPRGGIPFDMYQGGFGHRGEDCTFETLVKQFRIRDRRVRVMAQIVHDADLFDEKFGRAEGLGINQVLRGWDRQGLTDRELLERGMELVEGLYNSLA
jgi:hypothetical protein